MKRYTIYKDTKKETENRKYGQWTRDRKEVRDRVYVKGAWCVECGEEKKEKMVASLVVKKNKNKIGDERSVPFIPILGWH